MNRTATIISGFGTEIVFTAIGSVVIAAALGLLYRESRTFGSSSTETIGVVSYKYNSGQRKAERNMVWQDMEMEAPVFNRDTIRTAEQSEATVRLANGASISLDELSMVYLEVGSDRSDLKLERGSVRLKSSGGGAPLFIRSGNRTVRLDQGDLHATKSGDALGLLLREGTASSIPGDGTEGQTIEAGFQIHIDQTGAKKSEMGPAAISPADGSRLPMEADPLPVQFRWAAPDGPVIFELSRDRGFAGVLERKTLDSDTTLVSLPEGMYYWRVSSANRSVVGPATKVTLLPQLAQKTKGGVSAKEAAAAEVAALTVTLVSPANGSEIDLTATDRVAFRWRCSRNDARFTFQLRPLDPALPARGITLQTAQPLIVIQKSPDLPPGPYSWSVRAISGPDTAVSKTGTLRLSAPPQVVPQNDTPEVQYVE